MGMSRIISMSNDSKLTHESDGYIPNTGTITAKELAKRWKLRCWRNLQDKLNDAGIEHAEIAGIRIYRCESIEQLFWDE